MKDSTTFSNWALIFIIYVFFSIYILFFIYARLGSIIEYGLHYLMRFTSGIIFLVEDVISIVVLIVIGRWMYLYENFTDRDTNRLFLLMLGIYILKFLTFVFLFFESFPAAPYSST